MRTHLLMPVLCVPLPISSISTSTSFTFRLHVAGFLYGCDWYQLDSGDSRYLRFLAPATLYLFDVPARVNTDLVAAVSVEQDAYTLP